MASTPVSYTHLDVYKRQPYSFKKEILPELVTGEQDSLIQPRVEKALEHQTNRTRDLSLIHISAAEQVLAGAARSPFSASAGTKV